MWLTHWPRCWRSKQDQSFYFDRIGGTHYAALPAGNLVGTGEDRAASVSRRVASGRANASAYAESERHSALVAGGCIVAGGAGHMEQSFAATETVPGIGERSDAGGIRLQPGYTAVDGGAICAHDGARFSARGDRLYAPRDASVVRIFHHQWIDRFGYGIVGNA